MAYSMLAYEFLKIADRLLLLALNGENICRKNEFSWLIRRISLPVLEKDLRQIPSINFLTLPSVSTIHLSQLSL